MRRQTIPAASILLVFAIVVSAYGQEQGTFKDTRDGRAYRWVKIGNQTWMADNLDYAVSRGSAQYGVTYGRMYDWNTALRVCPAGWHLPSDSEWLELELSAGMNPQDHEMTFDRGASRQVGKKLKSKTGWRRHMKEGPNGTDDFGFSALPGGYYQTYTRRFMLYGTFTYFWTSTSKDHENAIARGLDSNSEGIERSDLYKVHGAYVRCVRD